MHRLCIAARCSIAPPACSMTSLIGILHRPPVSDPDDRPAWSAATEKLSMGHHLQGRDCMQRLICGSSIFIHNIVGHCSASPSAVKWTLRLVGMCHLRSKVSCLQGSHLSWRLTKPVLYITQNLKLVGRMTELAKAKGCKPGQLALAWVQHQGEDVFPIPGTKRLGYLEENIASLDIKLSKEELKLLEDAVPASEVKPMYKLTYLHGWTGVRDWCQGRFVLFCADLSVS